MTNPEATRQADECKRIAAGMRAFIAEVLPGNVHARDALSTMIDQFASMIPAGGLAEEARWQPMDTAPKVVGRIIGAVEGRARFICWGKTSHVPMYGWILTDQGPRGCRPLPTDRMDASAGRCHACTHPATGTAAMSAMRNTLHANLGHGGYRYEYEDGEGLRCTAVRPARNRPERVFWTHDMLPDEELPSLEAVKARLDARMPDDFIMEAGKYPHIGTVARDECGNSCRLCPRPEFTGAHVKHETWRFSVMTSWQGAWHASLCEGHTQQFADKPRELLAALKAEVAERKARAKPILPLQEQPR